MVMESIFSGARGDIVPTGSAAPHYAFSDREFKLISDRIQKLCGIHLPYSKRMFVYSRLSKRLRALGLDSFGAYCELLEGRQAEEELPYAIGALTTNFSRFFREPHHFDHLRSMVVPKVFTKKNTSRPIRFWSAGCATGEEAYSIAMTVFESVPNIQNFDFQILATDIDPVMIAKSEQAIYDVRELDSIPETIHGRTTVKNVNDQEGFGIDPAIKALVSFRKHNLIGEWGIDGPFDVIFCRNVMSHFDPSDQRETVDRMASLLAENGFLYTGHSENICRLTATVSPVGSTVYAKNTSR